MKRIVNRLIFNVFFYICIGLFHIIALVEVDAQQMTLPVVYKTEPFSFVSRAANIRLEGVLTVPENLDQVQKAVIFIASPHPRDIDNGGLYKTIADSLSKKGIATLRYNNRAYMQGVRSDAAGGVDLFDSARDAHDAFCALRSDPRFAGCRIGLLGHSEGGNSVAVEATENQDVAFVIVLSTGALEGRKIVYTQGSLPMQFSDMPADLKNVALQMLHDQIDATYEGKDTADIKRRYCEIMEKYYRTLPDKLRSCFFGNLSCEAVCRVINDPRFRWTRPHEMCFIKHHPSDYFSRIDQPSYAVYATMDHMINWEANMTALQETWMKSGKTNYEIHVVAGVNHSFYYSEEWVPFGSYLPKKQDELQELEKKKKEKARIINVIWNKLADWVLAQ